MMLGELRILGNLWILPVFLIITFAKVNSDTPIKIACTSNFVSFIQNPIVFPPKLPLFQKRRGLHSRSQPRHTNIAPRARISGSNDEPFSKLQLPPHVLSELAQLSDDERLNHSN
jgi:hypothetical protein